MIEKLTKSRFLAAPDSDRECLCAELAEALARRVLSPSSFHEEISQAIQALRALGHDLWSYDESDEFEIWGPDYVNPTGPGIIITFTLDAVRVEWVAR